MQQTKKESFIGRDHTWRYDAVLLAASLLLHAVLWWYLKNHYSFVYSMSDDMLYRDMVSGVLYGKVTHNIIYQHWFSVVLSALYSAVPSVEWCGMLTIFVNFISAVTIYYCLCKLARNIMSFVLANGLYVLFLLAYVRRFVFPTYTEIVGLLCAAAILLYYTAQKRGHHSRLVYNTSIVVCIVYAALGYSWRSESFLMMVPFAAAVWGADFLCADRKSRIRAGIFAGAVIAVIGGIILENKIAYSIEPYDRVMDYYDAKVAMTDYYGIPIYSEHTEAYEKCGISEEAAAFLFSRAYPLAPDYNSEGYVQLGEYAKAQKQERSFSEMRELLQSTLLFRNMGLLGHLAAWVLAGALVLSIFLKDKKNALGLGFLVLAYAFVAFYLVYRGRIPDRIVVMAYLIVFCIAAMYAVQAVNKAAEKRFLAESWIRTMILSAILGCAFLGVIVSNIKPCRQELFDLQNLYTIFADRERGIYQYFADHEDNFYLTTSFMWGTGGYVITEAEGIAHNYAFINGYMIMIPEWQQKLEENGIDVNRMLDSFAENEHVLLILNGDGLTSLIQEYLDDKFPGKQIVKVDEIIGFPVYNVE